MGGTCLFVRLKREHSVRLETMFVFIEPLKNIYFFIHSKSLICFSFTDKILAIPLFNTT